MKMSAIGAPIRRCWICLQSVDHHGFDLHGWSMTGQFFVHPVKAKNALEEGYIPTVCTCGQEFPFYWRRNRKALERFKQYILDHLEEDARIEDYVMCRSGYYVRRGTMDDDTALNKP